jgi:hypothetical protein
MDMVMDFLLLAASATACLYCFVLNRRLKGLTAAKTGLGAGIASLSQSAEEMKFAVAATKRSADEAATRLEKVITDADKKAAYLDDLINQLGEMSASVVAHAEGATQRYVGSLSPVIDEANAVADRLADEIARAADAEQALARKTPVAETARQTLSGRFMDESQLSALSSFVKGALYGRAGAAA